VSEEARLEAARSGLVPVTEGWFVVNVRDSAWLANEAFGIECAFEGGNSALRENPELEPHKFTEIGINLRVLQPGQPSGMYHAEQNQEDFLVLSGRCLAILEDEERHLEAWDFVHCPPGTRHVFVGAGDGPSVILMVGARTKPGEPVYGRSEVALRHGAGVEADTSSPAEAYARFSHWQPSRPNGWDGLPWG
jgi:uncharacterized cupin superfamily protein